MLSLRAAIAVSLAFLIFIAPAFAQVASSEDIQGFVNQYNSVYEKHPDAVKTLVGTETIKVSYTLLDGSTIVFGVKATDGKITDSSATPYASSTLAVSLSEETLNKIANSSDPLAAFKNAWGSEIKIEGLTFINVIKVFILNLIKIFTSVFAPQPPPAFYLHGSEGTITIIGPPGYEYVSPNSGPVAKQHFSTSEDIGKCGTVWNYTVVEGMSVVVKKSDGSFCKEYLVNICLEDYRDEKNEYIRNQKKGLARPYYRIADIPSRAPIGGKLPYVTTNITYALNLPEGWGPATIGGKDVKLQQGPSQIAESPQNSYPSSGRIPMSIQNFYIQKGKPTPPRVLCDGGTSTTATTLPPTTTLACIPGSPCATTTTISTTTTTGATTTTSTPIPDLEITPADISDATYNSSSRLYKLSITIKNIGSADSGLFNTSLIAYNSSSGFLANSLGYLPSYGYVIGDEFQTNNIPAGGQITKTYFFGFSDKGNKNNFMLNFTVDFQNQVSESNENNNFVSKNVSVVTTLTTTTTMGCGDALVMAYNPTSGECRSFAVNCVPSGWTVTQGQCPPPTTTTSAGLPDLSISASDVSSISYSDDLNCPNDSERRFWFVVRNLGKSDSGYFNISFQALNASQKFRFELNNRTETYYQTKDIIAGTQGSPGEDQFISYLYSYPTGGSPFPYNLPPGGYLNVTGRVSIITTAEPSFHYNLLFNLNITIDNFNQVVESNENNNFVSKVNIYHTKC